jgi:hypothetical protein
MPTSSWTLTPFRAVGKRAIPPDPIRTADAFSRVGYRLEESVADIIDNAIDAGARQVIVRFFLANSSIQRIAIIDNGRGLTDIEIDSAMQFGGPANKSDSALGKFGMGLKVASINQCGSVSLLSRHGKNSVGKRWTRDSIGNGWLCDDLNIREVAGFLNRDWGLEESKFSSGRTIVVWDDLDDQSLNRGQGDIIISKYLPILQKHLGLVYHRFISTGRICIKVDTMDAETGVAGFSNNIFPMDPFSYPQSGAEGYPTPFQVALKGYPKLEMEAHIWPPNSNALGYKLGGGQVAERQGFYFYRNDRLIQAGGWNKWRENETDPHLSLARVKVNLPIAFDGLFRLNVQKTQVHAPPIFIEALDKIQSGSKTFHKNFIQEADKTYRSGKAVKAARSQVSPGTGVPTSVRRETKRTEGPIPAAALIVNIIWKKLPKKNIFSIDIESSTIWVNSTYRASIKAGGRNLGLFKTMLYLLLKDEVKHERFSQEHKDALEAINRKLIAAIEEG